jgi:hypothetical protein
MPSAPDPDADSGAKDMDITSTKVAIMTYIQDRLAYENLAKAEYVVIFSHAFLFHHVCSLNDL